MVEFYVSELTNCFSTLTYHGTYTDYVGKNGSIVTIFPLVFFSALKA